MTKSIKVYDISGKMLISKQTSSNHLEIDLTSYYSGIYIFKIFTENEILTKKIIKY